MNKEMIKVPEMVHDDMFDIDIKPYLAVEEVEFIATEMISQSDYCAMEICKNKYLLQICVPNENFEGMNYETLKHSGVFDSIYFHVTNLDEIDKYISHATSVNVQLNEFLKTITELATKAEKKIPKSAELKKMFENLKEIKK